MTNDNLAWSLIIVGSAVFMFGVVLLAKALSNSLALLRAELDAAALSNSMALLKAELDAAKEEIDRAQGELSAIKRELATSHGNVPDAPPTAP